MDARALKDRILAIMIWASPFFGPLIEINLGKLKPCPKGVDRSHAPRGMHPVTLCVTFQKRNAERPWRHFYAERENDLPPSPHPDRSHSAQRNP